MKKYNISWSEEKGAPICIKENNLIKAFLQVYGVSEFVISWNRFTILGSTFIDKETKYDYAYYYMISCFLTPKKINKLYKMLVKDVR